VKLSERLAQSGDEAAARRVRPQAQDHTEESGTPVAPAPPAPTRRRTATVAPVPASRNRRQADRRQSHGRRASDAEPELEGVEGLQARVRSEVVATLGPALTKGDSVDEPRLRRELDAALDAALRTGRTTVSPSERQAFIEDTLADMLGWGPLAPLLENPDITEVMCNGYREIWVERGGRIVPSEVRFVTEQAYRLVIDRMLSGVGRRVDESSPMADGRLPDGSRVNVVLPPLAVGGAVLTIRKFPEQAFTVTDLIAMESLSADAAVFLEAAVRGKLNLVVSGGTGTGKTTLLNVLSSFIPHDERIITVEDAAELRLGQPHVVTLESRPPNIEGAGQVTIRDLVRNALRMRPDRIVVGEVRDAAALDMLQAMNTGHEGSMTTVHANSPRDALSRVETMVLFSGLDLPLRAIREQIASAMDVIVQLSRRPDGSRVVSQITEVQGREGETITLQDIYARTGHGPLQPTGLRPVCVERLQDRGVTLPHAHFRASSAALAARDVAPRVTPRSARGKRASR
jgi:pilus assembly protein CpaF